MCVEFRKKNSEKFGPHNLQSSEAVAVVYNETEAGQAWRNDYHRELMKIDRRHSGPGHSLASITFHII